MRNLKKVLALVLALMMTLSLMATASASDYNDGASIDYDEAVDVMSAVGVFNGTSGGNFDPEGSLTRAQAAKIITYMLLSKDVADALPNTGSKFSDCRDGEWYVGSVNYLTDLGIVAGRSATTFDPKGQVTGIEFAKMLLGALGYKSDKEGMEGTSSWATNIAILARQAGLDYDMTTSVLNSNALNRQQACQMAFNTMTSRVVYYKDSWGVTTPDGTQVNVPADRLALANNTGKGFLATGNDNVMQFCEMYFPGLKYDNTYSDPDGFGRWSAGQWLVNDDAVRTNTNKMAAVFVGATSAAAVKDALSGYAWEHSERTTEKDENDNDIIVTKKAGPTVVTNGTSGITLKSMIDTDDKAEDGLNEITKNGRRVEVYANEDKEIRQIVVFDYTLQTLTRVATAANGDKTYNFTDTKNANTSYKVTADGSKTEVVLEGDVAEGATVTTVVGSEDEAIHVYPTTIITGVQTSFDAKATTVVIAGQKYTIADNSVVAGVKAADIDNWANGVADASYYLDVNGFLVKSSVPSAADTFALIVGASGSVVNSVDGDTVAVQVRAVLSDGTVGVYDLKVGKAAEAKGDYAKGDYICGNVKIMENKNVSTDNLIKALPAIVENVYQYSISDGKMILNGLADGKTDLGKEGKNTIVGIGAASAPDKDGKVTLTDAYKGETSHIDKDSGGYDKVTTLMNNKTVFVLITGAGPRTTATTVTGTSGLKLPADGVVGTAVVTGAKGETEATVGAAKVVFLYTEAPAAEVVDYVYIDAAEFVESILEDETKVCEYKGTDANGEEITVYGPAQEETDDAIDPETGSGLYVYDADNMISADSKVADTGNDLSFKDKEGKTYLYGYSEALAAKAGMVTDGKNAYYTVTDDTKVVRLDDKATTWEGAECYVVLKATADGSDPTEVAAIFVVKAAAAKDDEKPSEGGDAGKFTAGTPSKNVELTATTDATKPDWTDTTAKDNTAALNTKKVTLTTKDGKTKIGEVTFVTTEPSGNTEVKVEATTSLKDALAAAQTALQAQATAAATAAAKGTDTYTAYTEITLSGDNQGAITAECTTTEYTYSAS